MHICLSSILLGSIPGLPLNTSTTQPLSSRQFSILQLPSTIIVNRKIGRLNPNFHKERPTLGYHTHIHLRPVSQTLKRSYLKTRRTSHNTFFKSARKKPKVELKREASNTKHGTFYQSRAEPEKYSQNIIIGSKPPLSVSESNENKKKIRIFFLNEESAKNYELRKIISIGENSRTFETIKNLIDSHWTGFYRPQDIIYQMEGMIILAQDVVQSENEGQVGEATEMNTTTNCGDSVMNRPERTRKERSLSCIQILNTKEKVSLDTVYQRALHFEVDKDIKVQHKKHVASDFTSDDLRSTCSEKTSTTSYSSVRSAAIKVMKQRHETKLLEASFFKDDSDSSDDEYTRRRLIQKPRRATKPSRHMVIEHIWGGPRENTSPEDTDSSARSYSSSSNKQISLSGGEGNQRHPP